MSSRNDHGLLALCLKEVIAHAKKYYDGHFTFFSFTTHYKGCYGTPYGEEFRATLRCLPQHTSFTDLIANMASRPELYDLYKLTKDKANVSSDSVERVN